MTRGGLAAGGALILVAAGWWTAQAQAEAPSAPLVVLVSLDTTRADRMGGAFGNTRGLTPNLDAFAAESTTFTNAWSVANLTSMAHAGLFTSRYPSEVGIVAGDFRLDGRVTTLADVFHAYGWRSAAFTSGGHLTRGFGLDRGFDVFDFTPFQGSLWHTVPAALSWLDGATGPQGSLLFVHGYDTHAPYLAPAPFGRAWTTPGDAPAGDKALATQLGTELIYGNLLFTPEQMLGFLVHRGRPRLWDDEAKAAVVGEAGRLRAQDPNQVAALTEADALRVRDAYDGAIAYEDAMFGELLSGLRTRGRYDDAWIVVFGDHGESLGEDGRFGHGESLAAEELHVPLYVHKPGSAARVVNAPVSTLDLLPTLCEAFAFTAPAGIHGDSLVPWLAGQDGPAHDERFAEGNLGMVMVERGGSQLRFEGAMPGSPWFDSLLAAAALPGPAFRTVGPDAASLRASLQTWRGGLRSVGPAEPAKQADVDAMKANGYFTP